MARQRKEQRIESDRQDVIACINRTWQPECITQFEIAITYATGQETRFNGQEEAAKRYYFGMNGNLFPGEAFEDIYSPEVVNTK
jgi:plastocyanin domain-containing protein